MKNTTNKLSGLIITLVVAILLSGVVFAILAFIAGNLNQGSEGQMFASSISSITFGLIVGYKLALLRQSNKK